MWGRGLPALLAGLSPPAEAALRAALDDEAVIVTASTVDEMFAVLSTVEPWLVAAGPALSPVSWEILAEDLRRTAPQAALLAVVPADRPPGWDDVLRPDEADPLGVQRVVRSAHAVAAAHQRLLSLVLIDPLTEVLNRRGLERAIARESATRLRTHGPLTALLVDCDDFKRINDEHGMAAGDRTLRNVAAAILRSVRVRDTVARIGGDEFIVLLPDTRTWDAVEVADRIRASVRDAFPSDPRLSVSIGVRRLELHVATVADLLLATQGGLKLSKRVGKDQVRVADDLPDAVGFDPDVSLPPGERVHSFRSLPVVALSGGRRLSHLVRPLMDAEQALALAAQRATQSAWDLVWWGAAAQELPPDLLPVHLPIFPATLLGVPTSVVLSALPSRVPHRRIIAAIDEQFVSGDPISLRSPLEALRRSGMAVCLDTADLGRACLECLVLLRPEWVRLDVELTRDLPSDRGRRAAVARFVQVCHALDIFVIATTTDPATHAPLAELGVFAVAMESATPAPPTSG